MHILSLWEKLGDSKLLARGHRAPQKTGKEQFRQDLSPGGGGGGEFSWYQILWPVFHRFENVLKIHFLWQSLFFESQKSLIKCERRVAPSPPPSVPAHIPNFDVYKGWRLPEVLDFICSLVWIYGFTSRFSGVGKTGDIKLLRGVILFSFCSSSSSSSQWCVLIYIKWWFWGKATPDPL